MPGCAFIEALSISNDSTTAMWDFGTCQPFSSTVVSAAYASAAKSSLVMTWSLSEESDSVSLRIDSTILPVVILGGIDSSGSARLFLFVEDEGAPDFSEAFVEDSIT